MRLSMCCLQQSTFCSSCDEVGDNLTNNLPCFHPSDILQTTPQILLLLELCHILSLDHMFLGFKFDWSHGNAIIKGRVV